MTAMLAARAEVAVLLSVLLATLRFETLVRRRRRGYARETQAAPSAAPRHRGEAAAESRHCLRRCCCARAREAAIVRAASAWPRNCGRPSEAQPAIVLAPTVLVRVRVRVRDGLTRTLTLP